jgi:hypothetical protein
VEPAVGLLSASSGTCCTSAPFAAAISAARSGAASVPGAKARKVPDAPGVTTLTGFGPSSRTRESTESVSSSQRARGEASWAGCAKVGGLRAVERLWKEQLSVGVDGERRGEVAGKKGLLEAKVGETPTVEFCRPVELTNTLKNMISMINGARKKNIVAGYWPGDMFQINDR